MATESSRGSDAASAFKATEQFKEAAAMVREDVREMGALAKEAAREQVIAARERGRAKAREVGQSLEEYVQDQPIKALVIAAGIGMALGWMMKRR